MARLALLVPPKKPVSPSPSFPSCILNQGSTILYGFVVAAAQQLTFNSLLEEIRVTILRWLFGEYF